MINTMGRIRSLGLLVLLMLSGAAVCEPLPRAIEVKGIPFVLIPEGYFTYTVETGGSVREMQPGQPFYREVSIWLDSFYIGRWEARASTLARFLNEDNTPESFKSDYQAGWNTRHSDAEGAPVGCTMTRDALGEFHVRGDSYSPATDLSWELANQFALGLGFRLPTEAQWQKAARGDDGRIWPWGDTYPDDTYALFGMGRGCHPLPVNRYPQGASPFATLQMAGNVNEFVADWYNEAFDAELKDGDRNPSLAASGSSMPFRGPMRISKGGDWGGGATFLATGFRTYREAHRPQNRAGVRFALDADRVINMLRSGEATVLLK